MPIIEFTAGKLSREVKDKLITQLTDISVEITGIPKHLFFITINEKPDEDIAIGGVSVQKLKEELSKQNNNDPANIDLAIGLLVIL
jgi:4-oxalocrotonate tautomerase